MSAKQDRTYTRTASDLERKLNLKERFSSVMGVAEDAQRAAEEVLSSVVGANILTGTRDFSGSDWIGLSLWADDGKYNGLTVKSRTGAWQALKQYINVIAGEVYTISAYVKSTARFSFACNAGNAGTGGAQSSQIYHDACTDWTRISNTFTVTKTGTISPGFESVGSSDKMWICGLKIESGSKATEWCPSPLDSDVITHEKVFNALTENGEMEGIYKGTDGQIYINASYLASGIISSKDGKIKINLQDGTEPVFNTGISTNGLNIRGDSVGAKTVFTLDATTITANGVTIPTFRFIVQDTDGNAVGAMNELFEIINGVLQSVGFQFRMKNDANTRMIDMATTSDTAEIRLRVSESGTVAGKFVMLSDGKSELQVNKINGKTVSWRANGDGTSTLIGT